ncbi:hypothetical protein SAMN02745165_00765 [Malonomonas rubra DSM 5091]|uniref:Probable membrane transporter protein n=1 Tax=Malonomonas rubra DSM 5091 TaxID=1122189 RepID=A0A1M6DQ00_MALRU|nr:sulfite exporter TauE/SafE family protein [Malonomonas rubra]SHI75255.1 hypothetical protein SAMN02745165_00765 [Malonomonas rubra DSM 5091]
MIELSLETFLLTGAIFLLAAFFHGSIGFGFPMVATPLLALSTNLQTAIILTLLPTTFVNLTSIANEGQFLRAFRKHLPLALCAMTGSAIGTQILIVSNSELFKVLLAVAILGYLMIDKFQVRLEWVERRPNLSMLIFGFTAGVLGGLTNVMAPILIIYSLEAKFEKAEIVQLANICFLFGKAIQLALFTLNGKFALNELMLSSTMLLLVFIALFAGFKIKRRIQQQTYKQVLRTFLFLLSLSLLYQVVG